MTGRTNSQPALRTDHLPQCRGPAPRSAQAQRLAFLAREELDRAADGQGQRAGSLSGCPQGGDGE